MKIGSALAGKGVSAWVTALGGCFNSVEKLWLALGEPFFLLSCTKRHRKCSFHLVDMANSRHSICCDTGISDAGGVWFSLNGTTYQNNSLVTLEDIGEGDGALLCLTSKTACCRLDYWGSSATGNWFFPNETRVSSSSSWREIYRTRGQMVVSLHRSRGGEEGIYRCEIPDAIHVAQAIYIGVYTADTGE